jgi:uncharacterized cupin superfamily protein
VEVFNVFGDELDQAQEVDGFRWRRARLAPLLGGAELGLSVFELPPGERTFPYHFHHANEEWLLVLAGEPTLREPDGERRLRPGDVVCFPPGPVGAHQLRNDGAEPARLALLATAIVPEVVEYPDSAKVGIRADGASYNVLREPELDYWHGEAEA